MNKLTKLMVPILLCLALTSCHRSIIWQETNDMETSYQRMSYHFNNEIQLQPSVVLFDSTYQDTLTYYGLWFHDCKKNKDVKFHLINGTSLQKYTPEARAFIYTKTYQRSYPLYEDGLIDKDMQNFTRKVQKELKADNMYLREDKDSHIRYYYFETGCPEPIIENNLTLPFKSMPKSISTKKKNVKEHNDTAQKG